MITVRQALNDLYLPNRPGLSPRTVRRYRYELNRWERYTSNPCITEVNTLTFNQYRAACLNHGLKPSSIESGIRTILQVLRLVGPEQERRQGLGLIPKVPFVGQQLRYHAPLRSMPTVEDLRKMFDHASAAIWPKTCQVDRQLFWRAWIGTAFVTGWRLSDAMQAKSYQLSGDLLTITSQKTGITQAIPIPPWLIPLLYRLPKFNGLLFPAKPLPKFIRRELVIISQAAGIHTLTPHAIRRASITEWSAVNSDCGAIIHGQGLGIRSRYVDPVRVLRTHLPSLPNLNR